MAHMTAFTVQIAFETRKVPRHLLARFSELVRDYEREPQVIHFADVHHAADAFDLVAQLRALTRRMDACRRPITEDQE